MPKHHTVHDFISAYRKLKGPVLAAFDFDGTLVGFRKTPGTVALSGPMRKKLERMAVHTEVAIISGRGLKNLATKVEGLDLHLAGSHGFEIRHRNGKTLLDAKDAWVDACDVWKRKSAELIAHYPELRGARIEDKRFSMTMHFRHTKDPVLAQSLYTDLIAKARPRGRIIGGYFVTNVVPRVSRHKGDAVRHLLKATACRSAIFIGDDVTDEDVFRLNLPHVLTVRVGGENEETAAKLHVKDRAEVRKIVTFLARKPTQSPKLPLPPSRKGPKLKKWMKRKTSRR